MIGQKIFSTASLKPQRPSQLVCLYAGLFTFELNKFRSPFLLLITLLILFAEEETVDPGRLQLGYF